MPESKTLTYLQRRYCEARAAGLKGTDALRKVEDEAGRKPRSSYNAYTVKVAHLNGLPQVQEYMAQLEARAREEAGVTIRFVLEQLKAVAGFDIRKIYNADGTLKRIDELDDETAAAVASIEIEEVRKGKGKSGVRRRTKKVRHWNKTEALRLLAQILGLMKDQVELSGPGGGPVKYERIEIVGVEPAKKHPEKL